MRTLVKMKYLTKSRKGEGFGGLGTIGGIILLVIIILFLSGFLTKTWGAYKDSTSNKECSGTCRAVCLSDEFPQGDICVKGAKLVQSPDGKNLKCCATALQMAAKPNDTTKGNQSVTNNLGNSTNNGDKGTTNGNSQISNTNGAATPTYIELRYGELPDKITTKSGFTFISDRINQVYVWGTGPGAAKCSIKILSANGQQTTRDGLTLTMDKQPCKTESNKKSVIYKPKFSTSETNHFSLVAILYDDKGTVNQSIVIPVTIST